MSAAEEPVFQMEGESVHPELGATTNSSGTPQPSVPIAQQPYAVKPDIAVVKTEVVDRGTSIDTEVRDYQTHTMFHNPSVDTPAFFSSQTSPWGEAQTTDRTQTAGAPDLRTPHTTLISGRQDE